MTNSPSPQTLPALSVRPLSIGPLLIDPPVLQAPMAGFTNYAYRQIARQLGGVGLPATEMVSARGFLEIDLRREEYPERLWGVKDEPRPLAVQIWDNNPETLAAVGQRLAQEFAVSVVDINFGCPVRVVTERAQSGSYLLRYPDQVGNIVARVVDACRPTPVTAKIRLGYTRDSINAIDVAQAIEGAGAAAVTIHGRTAQDMFRGSADWEKIAQVKPHLHKIPLIGNGDLARAESVVQVMRQFPVDGVMIGRAALARPWLFREVRAALAGQPIPREPTLREQQQLLLEHFRLTVARFGPERATVLMRKYACCYSHGHRGARRFRGEVCRVTTAQEFVQTVERFFCPDDSALHDATPDDSST